MSTAAAASSSSSASRSLSPRQPTSPPPSIASPSTTPALAHAPAPAPPPPFAPLQPTLPSAETQRHVAEARSAVVATLENMMDSELQWRATTLHANSAVLGRQAADVQRATDGLRREREKLAREADAAARRLKELGNVQNWAEVLERDFLVLEETVRLANGGGSSCSCSDCGSGSETGSVMSDDDHGGDRMDVDVGKKLEGAHDEHGDPSKTRADEAEMAIDSDGATGTWSEASRSLTEPASSTGTGRGAKGSDTASVSTAS
ncbi:hypothetical protein BGZ61DRAFT_443587 [Ilyonectria robusta]|uniref:uncharacterized protein n=1 Tax=Ilyonectria robusta TaxID=1079257 RepID=UPI001E8D517C|nr:uncharacterized protein BGZ61DRAFT_443587 [Ilyonectria robusta]KAH8735032.1 hypothetical protein BGZ61DRAFT_443587 [Ilyonectria robusta]